VVVVLTVAVHSGGSEVWVDVSAKPCTVRHGICALHAWGSSADALHWQVTVNHTCPSSIAQGPGGAQVTSEGGLAPSAGPLVVMAALTPVRSPRRVVSGSASSGDLRFMVLRPSVG
jgi:hypothetical protein